MIIPEAWQTNEKAVEYEGGCVTNCGGCPWNNLQGLGKETEETGNQKNNWDHQDHSTIKII